MLSRWDEHILTRRKGVPFDTDDSIFNPPTSQNPSQVISTRVHRDRPSSPVEQPITSRNRIIPVEEDRRRLFQECKIGQGNAALLSEALTFAKPEDLARKEIIRVGQAMWRVLLKLTYLCRSFISNAAPHKNSFLHKFPGPPPALTIRELQVVRRINFRHGKMSLAVTTCR